MYRALWGIQYRSHEEISFLEGIQSGPETCGRKVLKKFSTKSAESCLLRQGQTVNQAHYAAILMRLFATMHRQNCDPTIGSSIMATLQLTKHHLSSSPCWTEHPVMEWIRHQWLLALLSIKIQSEGIRFFGHHRHSVECDDKFEGIWTEDFYKCFQQWQHGWA